MIKIRNGEVQEVRESTLPDVGVTAWFPLTPFVEAAQGAQGGGLCTTVGELGGLRSETVRYKKSERARYLM
jgi:hypothetical protein